jgi:diguanylate cyclase (GGDEF)-like protein
LANKYFIPSGGSGGLESDAPPSRPTLGQPAGRGRYFIESMGDAPEAAPPSFGSRLGAAASSFGPAARSFGQDLAEPFESAYGKAKTAYDEASFGSPLEAVESIGRGIEAAKAAGDAFGSPLTGGPIAAALHERAKRSPLYQAVAEPVAGPLARAYQAIEEAPAVAAAYGAPYLGLGSPGGEQVLSEGLTPEVPSIEQQVSHGALTRDQFGGGQSPLLDALPLPGSVKSYLGAIGTPLAAEAATLAASPTNAALLAAGGSLGSIAERGQIARMAGLEAESQLLSPAARAAMAQTERLGNAAQTGQRAVSAYFAKDMTPGLVQGIQNTAAGIGGNIDRPGPLLTPEVAGELGSTLLKGAFVGGVAAHAMEGGREGQAQYEGRLGEFHDQATTEGARLEIENAHRAALQEGQAMAQRKAAAEAQQQFAQAAQAAYAQDQAHQAFGQAGQQAFDEQQAREFLRPDAEAEANRQTVQSLREQRQALPAAIEEALQQPPGPPRLRGTPAPVPDDASVTYSDAARRAEAARGIEEQFAGARASAQEDPFDVLRREGTPAPSPEFDEFARAGQQAFDAGLSEDAGATIEDYVNRPPALEPGGQRAFEAALRQRGPRPPRPPMQGPPRPEGPLTIEERMGAAAGPGLPEFRPEEGGVPVERRAEDRRGRITRRMVDSFTRFVRGEADKAGAAFEAGDVQGAGEIRAAAEQRIAKLKESHPDLDTTELEAAMQEFPREKSAEVATEDAEHTEAALQARRAAATDARVKKRVRQLRKEDPKASLKTLEGYARNEDARERDRLTGIPNLDGWEQEQARNPGKYKGHAMIDAVGLKKINDKWKGHAAGDAFLRGMADLIDTIARRRGGHASRIGGDEFAILAKDVETAKAIAATIKRTLHEGHKLVYRDKLTGKKLAEWDDYEVDYGYGPDKEKADKFLYAFRERGEASGRRTAHRPIEGAEDPGRVAGEPTAGGHVPLGAEEQAALDRRRQVGREVWAKLPGVIRDLDHKHGEAAHVAKVFDKKTNAVTRNLVRGDLEAKVNAGLEGFRESGPTIAAALRAERAGDPTPIQKELANRALEAMYRFEDGRLAEQEAATAADRRKSDRRGGAPPDESEPDVPPGPPPPLPPRQDFSRSPELSPEEVPFDVPGENEAQARPAISPDDFEKGPKKFATRKRPPREKVKGQAGSRYEGQEIDLGTVAREQTARMRHVADMKDELAQGEVSDRRRESLEESIAATERNVADTWDELQDGAGDEHAGRIRREVERRVELDRGPRDGDEVKTPDGRTGTYRGIYTGREGESADVFLPGETKGNGPENVGNGGAWQKVEGGILQKYKADSLEVTLDSLEKSAGAAKAEAPAAEPTETYINGDRAVYTGKTQQLHGGTFYEVEMMEGRDKGKTRVTQKTPESVRELNALRDKRIAEDYPEEAAKKTGVVENTPAGQQKVMPGSLNFNPNVKRRTQGREGEGPLFTQEEDARIRKEGASQKSLFGEEPEPAKPAAEAAPVPKPGGQGSLLFASRLRTAPERKAAVSEIVRGIGERITELRPTAAKVTGLENLAEEAHGKAAGKAGEVEAVLDLNRIIKSANDQADARRLTGEARERAIAQDVAQRTVEATLHEAAHGPEGGHGPRFHARLADLRQALGRGFEEAVAGVRTQLLEQAAERARTSLTVDAVRKEFPKARRVQKAVDGFQVDLPNGRTIRINTEGEVFYDPKAFEEGHGHPLPPDEEIAGSWQKIDRGGVISLAKGEGAPTLRHEVFHSAMDLVLNPREKTAVLAKYGSEEKAAQAYATWTPEQPHSLFAKIHDFFARIYRRFRPDATGAFEAVHTGRAFERAGVEGEGGTAYATRPPGGPLPPGARTPPPATSPLSEETRGDKFVRLMQDRFIRAQRVIDAVVARGGTVTERTDFRTAEELFHGAVNEKVTDAEKRYIQPLAKALAKAKLDLPALDEFLTARHAGFRNAEIERRHEGRVTAGSGMSNKEAAKILADYNKRGLTAKLAPAVKLIDQMRDEQRKVLLDSGLVSQEQLNGWDKSMGPHYVPLRTAEVDGGMGTGQGFDIRGKEARFAAGRSTRADSPSMFMMAQLARAIVRGEKNKVGQRFAEFTKANPDPSLWEHNVEHKTWAPNAKGIARQVLNPHAEANDFDYKVNGEKQRITVKDPLLLRALKNMSATETNQFLQLAGRGTRLFSALVTSYSPEFPLTNFARDIQTALGNVTAEQGGKIARQMVKNIPQAVRGVYRSLRDPGSTDKWAKLAKEFREDGGAVGFYQLKHVPALEREVGRKIRGAGPGVRPAIGRALAGVRDYVEDVNKSVENGTRLAIYSAIRDAGGSRQKAASTALNSTINFSRKGEVGPAINSLYAFFNANVQGAARLAQVIRTPKGKKIAAGIIALGAAQDFYNRAVAGDANKDGTNDYDDIPEYIKGRNLVFMRGEGQKPILFPLPYGFNVLHTAGRQMVAATSGAVTPVRASANVLSGLANAFNPLGGESDLVQVLSPTALDPIVQDVMNRDFTGKPIRPERFPGSPEKPSSEEYFKNVSPVAREAAKMLNKATGGDSVTPGYISVSPETMSHYWNFLTGGMGRFLSNTAATGASLAEGKEPPIRNIPYARRFVYEAPQSQAGQKFRANADELETLWGRYKTYAKARDNDKVKSLPMPMLRAKKEFDSIEYRIREIRKQVKLQPAAQERADKAISDLQNRANAIVAQARRQSGRPPEPEQ